MIPSDKNGPDPIEFSYLSPHVTPPKEDAKAQLEITTASKVWQAVRATAFVFFTVGIGAALLINDRIRSAVLGGETVTLQGKVYYIKDVKEEINRQIIADAPLHSVDLSKASSHTLITNLKLFALREMLTPRVNEKMGKSQDSFETIMKRELTGYLDLKAGSPKYKEFMHFLRTNETYSGYTSAEASSERAALQRAAIEKTADTIAFRGFITEKALNALVATYKRTLPNTSADMWLPLVNDPDVKSAMQHLFDAIDSGKASDIASAKKSLNSTISTYVSSHPGVVSPVGLTEQLVSNYRGTTERTSPTYIKLKQEAFAQELERLKQSSTLYDAQIFFDYCMENRMNKLFATVTDEMDTRQFLKVALGREHLHEGKPQESIRSFVGFWETRKPDHFSTQVAFRRAMAPIAEGIDLSRFEEEESKSGDKVDHLKDSQDFHKELKEAYDKEALEAFDDVKCAELVTTNKHHLRSLKGLLNKVTVLQKNLSNQSKLLFLLIKLSTAREKMVPESEIQELENEIRQIGEDPHPVDISQTMSALIMVNESIAVIDKGIRDLKNEMRVCENQIIAFAEGPGGARRLYEPKAWLSVAREQIVGYRRILHNTVQLATQSEQSSVRDAAQQKLISLKRTAEEFRSALTTFQQEGNKNSGVARDIERLSLEIAALEGAQQKNYEELESLFFPNLQFAKDWYTDPANQGKSFWVHIPSGKYVSAPTADSEGRLVKDEWRQATAEESEQLLTSLLADGHGQYDMALNRAVLLHLNLHLEAREKPAKEALVSLDKILSNLANEIAKESQKVRPDQRRTTVTYKTYESIGDLRRSIDLIMKEPNLDNIKKAEKQAEALSKNEDLTETVKELIQSAFQKLTGIREYLDSQTPYVEDLHNKMHKLAIRMEVRERVAMYRASQEVGSHLWFNPVSQTYQAGKERPGKEWQKMSHSQVVSEIPRMMRHITSEDIQSNDFVAIELMSMVNSELLPYHLEMSEGGPSIIKLDPSAAKDTSLTRLDRDQTEFRDLDKIRSSLPKGNAVMDPVQLKRNLLIAVCCYTRLAASGKPDPALFRLIDSYKSRLQPLPVTGTLGNLPYQNLYIDAAGKIAARQQPKPDANISVPMFNAYIASQGGVDALFRDQFFFDINKAVACYQYVIGKLGKKDADAAEYRDFLLGMEAELAEGLSHADDPIDEELEHLNLFKEIILPDLMNRFSGAELHKEFASIRLGLELKYRDSVHPGTLRAAYRDTIAQLDRMDKIASLEERLDKHTDPYAIQAELDQLLDTISEAEKPHWLYLRQAVSNAQLAKALQQLSMDPSGKITEKLRSYGDKKYPIYTYTRSETGAEAQKELPNAIFKGMRAEQSSSVIQSLFEASFGGPHPILPNVSADVDRYITGDQVTDHRGFIKAINDLMTIRVQGKLTAENADKFIENRNTAIAYYMHYKAKVARSDDKNSEEVLAEIDKAFEHTISTFLIPSCNEILSMERYRESILKDAVRDYELHQAVLEKFTSSAKDELDRFTTFNAGSNARRKIIYGSLPDRVSMLQIERKGLTGLLNPQQIAKDTEVNESLKVGLVQQNVQNKPEGLVSLGESVKLFSRTLHDYQRYGRTHISMRYTSEADQKEDFENYTLQLTPEQALAPTAHMENELLKMRKGFPESLGGSKAFTNILHLHSLNEFSDMTLAIVAKTLEAGLDIGRLKPAQINTVSREAPLDIIDMQISKEKQISERTVILCLTDNQATSELGTSGDCIKGYFVVTQRTEVPMSLLQKETITAKDIQDSHAKATIVRSELLTLDAAVAKMQRIRRKEESLFDEDFEPEYVNHLNELNASEKSQLAEAFEGSVVKLPEKALERLLPPEMQKLEALEKLPQAQRPIVLHLLLNSTYVDQLLSNQNREEIDEFCKQIESPQTQAAMRKWFYLVLPEKEEEIHPVSPKQVEAPTKVSSSARYDLSEKALKPLSSIDKSMYQCIAKFNNKEERLMLLNYFKDRSAYNTFVEYRSKTRDERHALIAEEKLKYPDEKIIDLIGRLHDLMDEPLK